MVSVSENLVSQKSFGFGFRKFDLEKKVSVSVSKKLGLRKKSRFRVRKKKSRFRYQLIWSRKKISVLESLVSEKKNPNNKNSARNEVPNLGLGPNWYQSPKMVPNKSQFCCKVQNFIPVARCQAKSHISLINSTVAYNKKTCNL